MNVIGGIAMAFTRRVLRAPPHPRQLSGAAAPESRRVKVTFLSVESAPTDGIPLGEDYGFVRGRAWSLRFSLAVLTAAICAVMFLIVAVLTVRDLRWLAVADSADGRVVNLIEKRSCNVSGNSCGYEYYPEVQFVSADGKAHQFLGSRGEEPRMLGNDPLDTDVGDRVRVLYNPADPGDARLDTWIGRWGLGTAAAVAGALAAVIIVALLLFRRTAEWTPPQGPPDPQPGGLAG